MLGQKTVGGNAGNVIYEMVEAINLSRPVDAGKRMENVNLRFRSNLMASRMVSSSASLELYRCTFNTANSYS